MKNILSFFVLFVLCSCGYDNEHEPWDNIDESITTTRSFDTTLSIYCDTFQYNFRGKYTGFLPSYIVSYKKVNGTTIPLNLEVIDKPTWINGFTVTNPYIGAYLLTPIMDANTSMQDRVGPVILRQTESGKALSYHIVQKSSIDNRITITITSPYANHYIFTATTKYPVKEAVTIRIPYEVYNDGGEMKNQSARIDIAKNQTSGSYIMDYNGSPLVYYHGNLKGYRLYEGTIQANTDDIYTYSFNRYW